MSGLNNKQNEQNSACSCACNGLLVELLQTMKAQMNLQTEQNKVMAQIMDQNSELIARFDVEGDEDTPNSGYLDD